MGGWHCLTLQTLSKKIVGFKNGPVEQHLVCVNDTYRPNPSKYCLFPEIRSWNSKLKFIFVSRTSLLPDMFAVCRCFGRIS